MHERARFKVAAVLPDRAERLRLSVGPGKESCEAVSRVRVIARRLLPPAYCLLLTAYCLLPSAVAAATWTRQASGTMAWLRAVYFVDQNRGWAAGSGGTLLQTIDGGATWKRVSVLTPVLTPVLTKDTLHDVYFADENIGWLVAERDLLKLKTNDEPRSYLLKTEDGGLSWQRIFLDNRDENSRLIRLLFTDSQHGWAFGENGTVFATRDGGAQWLRQA